MIVSWRSLGSLPWSQQQTRSSWSLICNARPPSFQSSCGIPSTPAALQLFKCSMVLVIFFIESSSSNTALNSNWGIWRTAGSWTPRSAQERDWKCSDQQLRMETLSGKSSCPSAMHKGLYIQWVDHTLLFRNLCSHLGLRVADFSLWDWSSTHFGYLDDCAGGCCKWDGRQPSSRDMTAEPVGLGGMISSSLAVPLSLDCSR